MPVSKNRRKSKKPSKSKRKAKNIIVTVALYGPDDTVATKMVVSAVNEKTRDIKEMKKWYSEGMIDVREIDQVVHDVADFVGKWNPSTIVSPDRIFGCPHEEGIDYPENESCPECPFWRERDRFTGDLLTLTGPEVI